MKLGHTCSIQFTTAANALTRISIYAEYNLRGDWMHLVCCRCIKVACSGVHTSHVKLAIFVVDAVGVGIRIVVVGKRVGAICDTTAFQKGRRPGFKIARCFVGAPKNLIAA